MRLGCRLPAKLAVVFLAVATGGTASVVDASNLVLPAQVMPYDQALVEEKSYPVFDAKGKSLGLARWRVIQGTGNCCENFLSATANGDLLDLGGTYLRFSEDKGQTWFQVRTIEPLVNGEGAVSVAPNGDIIGMTWDPYSGDHIVTFKYDVEEEAWLYSETKLHTPFFDRPWLAVVRGPFDFAGIKAPYISILMSNFSFYREIFYVSIDGLNYFVPSVKDLDQLRSSPVKRWLDLPRDEWADLGQPLTESGITPLPKGGALAAEIGPLGSGSSFAILESPDATWASFETPKGPLDEGRLLADSRGRLHHVVAERGEKSFVYSLSSNGGRSFDKARVRLPKDHEIEDFDYRAHGRLGMTVIAIHAHNSDKDVDQDLLYRFSTGTGRPKLKRVYFVGDGDENVGSSFGANIRFDFATTTIMPDGTIATSFVDKSHNDPAIALLLDSR
jgi:hypothetical protein